MRNKDTHPTSLVTKGLATSSPALGRVTSGILSVGIWRKFYHAVRRRVERTLVLEGIKSFPLYVACMVLGTKLFELIKKVKMYGVKEFYFSIVRSLQGIVSLREKLALYLVGVKSLVFSGSRLVLGTKAYLCKSISWLIGTKAFVRYNLKKLLGSKLKCIRKEIGLRAKRGRASILAALDVFDWKDLDI